MQMMMTSSWEKTLMCHLETNVERITITVKNFNFGLVSSNIIGPSIIHCKIGSTLYCPSIL